MAMGKADLILSGGPIRGTPGEKQRSTGSVWTCRAERSATFAANSGLYFGLLGGGGAADEVFAGSATGSHPRTQIESPLRSGCTKSMPEPLSQVPVRSGCPSGIRGIPSAALAAPESESADAPSNKATAPRARRAAGESELVLLCMTDSPN